MRCPPRGKLQVLDFLGMGDVVSVPTVLPTSRVSLRAITNASLVVLDSPESSETVVFQDYWTFLMARCTNQLTRTYVHQLMIGRLETEPRVGPLALRSAHRDTRATTVALPMSRDDIADYLVINCDT
jgi:CRP/FNR family transcriptional regulator, anaerobic regulatory protein